MREKYYTKKPIPVAALYWDGTDDDVMVDSIDYFLQSVPATDDYAPMFTVVHDMPYITLNLDTLEGTMYEVSSTFVKRISLKRLMRK
jgi:hypothetical protein